MGIFRGLNNDVVVDDDDENSLSKLEIRSLHVTTYVDTVPKVLYERAGASQFWRAWRTAQDFG